MSISAVDMSLLQTENNVNEKGKSEDAFFYPALMNEWAFKLQKEAQKYNKSSSYEFSTIFKVLSCHTIVLCSGKDSSHWAVKGCDCIRESGELENQISQWMNHSVWLCALELEKIWLQKQFIHKLPKTC